jgi:NitT/TauT family transport system substrate-binding protein
MKFFKPIIAAALLCTLLTSICGYASSSEKPLSIQFGTIPVLQSLPLFVAAEKGFFREQGLSVDIVLFNSAMEKDIALSSGRIAGYFGDLMTPMVLQANHTGVRITATNFNTTREQRMFAVLTSPRSTNIGLEEIAKAGIATSTNTISEYLITRFLQQHKISKDKINFIDVKNIPIRLQMLLSSQVPAALLPEPLASLAESKGARPLLDDKGRGLSATVLAFSEKFLRSNPQAVKAFQTAVDEASDYINRYPQKVRTIMNRECKIPEPFKDAFPIPKFPKLTAPSLKQVMDVYDWLHEKKIITRSMTYKEMVADGYLP